uniref:Secreted protein n=1 Tax=Arundo donax TaxID=35708 RepID=A0A0A9E697_ARUDO
MSRMVNLRAPSLYNSLIWLMYLATMPAMNSGASLMGTPPSSNAPKSLPPVLTTNRDRPSTRSSLSRPTRPARIILALVFLNSWTCSRRLIVPFPVMSRMPDPPEA